MASLYQQKRRQEGEAQTPDGRLAQLAARQYGVFSRHQAVESGFSNAMIRHRLNGGRWLRPHTGVYALAGVPESWHQTVMAAWLCFDGRAIVSRRAAAPLWELAGFVQGSIDLIVPRSIRRQPKDVTLQRSAVDRTDITRRASFAVTKPERTLIDLAGIADETLIEIALDDALRRRLVSISTLRKRLEASALPGVHGVALIRRLVETRSEAGVVQSVFETRLLRQFRRSRLPRPVIQHPILAAGRLVAVIDFAYPVERIAIEADGYRWHSGRLQWQRDLARRNTLTELGWTVFHVTWSDITQRPDATMRSIAAALGRRKF